MVTVSTKRTGYKGLQRTLYKVVFYSKRFVKPENGCYSITNRPISFKHRTRQDFNNNWTRTKYDGISLVSTNKLSLQTVMELLTNIAIAVFIYQCSVYLNYYQFHSNVFHMNQNIVFYYQVSNRNQCMRKQNFELRKFQDMVYLTIAQV